MSPSSTPRADRLTQLRLLKDSVDWREVDGEIVALHAGTATYFAANRTATALWQALAEGADRDELVQRLVDEFGVEAATAGADIDRFVTELKSHDLLER